MEKKSGYPASALRICIDGIINEDKDISGRIYGVAVEECAEFFGCSELFVTIDRLLDDIGKPQSSRKSRSFRVEEEQQTSTYCVSPKIYHEPDEIREQKGKLATRDVFFVSRLRSSWQGVMKDTNNEILGHFDSELEFIDLLYDRRVTVV